MSKTYAALVSGAVLGLTALLPKWTRISTLARTSSRLIPLVDVETKLGGLTFYTPTKMSTYWPRYAYGSEPGTLAWIDSFAPGAVFWDVGASVGIFSLYAGLRGDVQVLSFEPNPYTFNCLVNNVRINRLAERVQPYCVALAERPQLGKFYMQDSEAGTVGNSFGDAGASQVRGDAGPIAVSTVALSLDRLLEFMGSPFPTHIKFDVDSIEDKIIAGGARVLSDPRVKSVLVEVMSGTEVFDRRAEKIIAMMAGYGLRIDEELSTESFNKTFVRG